MNSETIVTFPNGWRSIRLKWLLSTLESGRREVSNTDNSESGVLSIGGEHIGWQGQWQLENPRYVSREFFAAMSSGKIQQNDVLLVKDGATIGQVAIAERLPAVELAVNEHVFLLRFTEQNYPKFYFYFVQSSIAQDQIQLAVRGSTQPGLNSEFCNTVIAPQPPLAQQRIIADNLDRETARLDGLVEVKERLLELLAEKRRALITSAITHGLDPTIPLRDSDLPLLGEIPSHWSTSHLKRVLSNMDYGISESVDVAGKVAALRMGDLQDGEIEYSNVGFVEDVDTSLLLQPDDLLFNRTNCLDKIGKVAIFRGNYEYPVTFTSYLVRLRCNTKKALPEFLNIWLNSSHVIAWARSEAFPAIGQVNLNPNRYAYIPIALPPISEQRVIVAQILTETSKLNALRTVTEKTIALLKERRAALIAAAVMGQIKMV